MTDFSKRIAALSPQQKSLLKLRLKQKNVPQPQTSLIPKIATSDTLPPASFAQQRMWFQNQLGDKSATSNNIPVTLKISGPLQIAILEQSIREIIQRHEILRTTLKTVNKQLVQDISPAVPWSLPLIDLRSRTAAEQEKQAQQLAIEEACKPFDLTDNLFLRITLLHLDATEYIMLMTMHHIVADAWSIGVFFRELNTIYTAFLSNKPSPLTELPIQYADFAVWQRQYIQGTVLAQELSYWKQQLQGSPTLLQLPTDRPRPPVHSFAGKTQSFLLPKTLTESLKTLSQQAEVTLFMTLLAAFQTLLYRYTRQEDILVGSPIANRHQAEIEGLIGCFINTLVLRTNLSGNPSFRELLNRVREVALGAFAHQNLPFEKLVEELQLARNLSYSPLFQVMFVLQNATSSKNIELPGLTMHYSLVDNHTAQFDITIHLVEEELGLVGRLEYNTDLFDDSTITRMIGHFQTLLAGIVINPDQRLWDLPMLTSGEERQLRSWNQTEVDYSQDACIHQLFESFVEKTPDAVAVVFEDVQTRHVTSLTYRELNQRANQLAHYLKKQGVKSEVLVGICVERSITMIVGLLGILKAGGAYVPLDPRLPQQRLAFILSDAQVSVLLTQEHLVANLPDFGSPVVCLDADWEFIGQESEQNLATQSTAENLAYAIYTSGSTGKPKGVMVQHQSLVNYTEAAMVEYALSNSDSEALPPRADRILQFASISFDAANEEIFPCLAQGATLVLRTEEVLSSTPAFLKFCRDWQLTVLDLPTAFWHQLVVELLALNLTIPDSVRLVIIGGEKALPERLTMWQQQVGQRVRLVNSYGPTEATIVTTICDLSGLAVTDRKELPIGKAIANAKTYILDPHLNLTPVGVPGELYIGGVGVARGYLNRPDLTAVAFIPNPFSETPGARLYKTGDLVRYRTDGNIEFLGRIDRQVKVRGFRIELKEIEALLAQHPEVQETVVIDREDQPGDKRLVAYVVPKPERIPTTSDLRRFIEKKLPKYMIPEAFVMLKALPLNPNGKVDRWALPTPDTARPELEEAFVAPRTSLEEVIAGIFSQVLEVERVGVHDDFFELGGNSLLITQLIAQLQQAFGMELKVVDLFEAPTVAGLAERIEMQTQFSSFPVEKIDEAEVVLDPTICPATLTTQFTSEPASILLTGSTGFLGAFLLSELLQQTQANIYCLVRAENSDLGKKKIQSHLEFYLLWDESFSARIIPVIGDLSQPLLGLSKEQFQVMANQIDVIYHNGALVNLFYPYTALKAINVLGTQEILRLASQIKVKPVHFISTLSVVQSVSYFKDKVVKEENLLDCWEELYNGYAQSKWVAEKIVAEANSRGIPVSIYRPGMIAGSSQTGICKTQDLLSTLLKSFIELKSAPDMDALWDITPVDYVSKSVIHLSKQKESLGKVFHLLNPHPIHLSTIVELLRSFGYLIQQISYDQWRADLMNYTINSQENALKSLLLIFPESFSEEQLQVLQLKFDCQNTLDGLAGSSISCPLPNVELISTYLSYFIQDGFFNSPHSKHYSHSA